MAEAIVNTASAAAGAGHDDRATKADLRTATDPLGLNGRIWLAGCQDSNLGMRESKSRALPLGYTPM